MKKLICVVMVVLLHLPVGAVKQGSGFSLGVFEIWALLSMLRASPDPILPEEAARVYVASGPLQGQPVTLEVVNLGNFLARLYPVVANGHSMPFTLDEAMQSLGDVAQGTSQETLQAVIDYLLGQGSIQRVDRGASAPRYAFFRSE